MFENPRRGRQARNFTSNVPKIVDLKSSSEQLFSQNCRWVPLMHLPVSPTYTLPHSQGILFTFPSCFRGSTESLSRTQCDFSVVSDLKTDRTPQCCGQRRTGSDKPLMYLISETLCWQHFYHLKTEWSSTAFQHSTSTQNSLSWQIGHKRFRRTPHYKCLQKTYAHWSVPVLWLTPPSVSWTRCCQVLIRSIEKHQH